MKDEELVVGMRLRVKTLKCTQGTDGPVRRGLELHEWEGTVSQLSV